MSFGDVTLRTLKDLLCSNRDDVGEQLGRAVGKSIDGLAELLYAQAKHPSLNHMSEGRAIDMMLDLHLEFVKEDE